jgi:poly(A) polymerase Pap1
VPEFQELLHKQSPTKAIEYLLTKFFKFYSKWEWPNPVNLFNAQPSMRDGKRHWNPISSVSDS